jgi:hypothetical protein
MSCLFLLNIKLDILLFLMNHDSIFIILAETTRLLTPAIRHLIDLVIDSVTNLIAHYFLLLVFMLNLFIDFPLPPLLQFIILICAVSFDRFDYTFR